ncbi:DUF5133 domain-containing protein [Streptomyces spectabilis]|uniref:DUF5133 domain-containing protein n=1 Tax=Streptomyces spectabilis TaxID=68270 RepID=A0A5P2XLM6_STRST|nr:DUF5133 domain-containing protein [Streptomyces spectabilis]MCI3900459.1 DUF5133 domain-containing protein [Streptomyces spectabilis]QEV64454.1 DUF5133 domain-containing protein [Streptomyces spectabilis]
MLMPDPKALRVLLARYADLRIAAPPTEATRRALEDVSYTLCVMTGVNRVDDALGVADALLAEPGPEVGRARAEVPQVPDARPVGRADEVTLPRPSVGPATLLS